MPESNIEASTKARDKLRNIKFNPTVEIELEQFRGQITAAKVPRGVMIRIYDFDVLTADGDDIFMRKGVSHTKEAPCMITEIEGPR